MAKKEYLKIEAYFEGIEKIRSCFSGADESKTVNCVSASVAAQHIEASIKRIQ